MSGCHFYGSFQVLRYAALALFVSVFAGVVDARSKSDEGSPLSKLNVVEHLKEYEGGYSDLFDKLKENRDFQRVSRRHRIDDPALWPALEKRFVLKLAALQGDFKQAESMMQIKDRRGGLSNQVISAEKTREEGRQLRDRLDRQMEELRQMLRLMAEMEKVLKNVSREHALTDVITLANQENQAFRGQVLFIDGKDLIVKREDESYFRVPSKLLSEGTKLTIINQALSAWEELPGQELELESGETIGLIAHNDSMFYVEHDPEGLVAMSRPEGEMVFASYAAQLEAAREALSAGDREEKEELEQLVSDLEAGISLNQSRISEIQWYEARLGTEVPQSEQIELKSTTKEEPSPSEGETGAEPILPPDSGETAEPDVLPTEG